MANRKTDASIAFSVTDNLSQSVTRMRNSLDGFEQDVEGLQKQLDILQRTKVQLKNIDLKQAKSQVDEMRRALEELGDTATETERQTAQANFDAAVQNYNNVANQLDLVSRRARQTQKDLLNTTDAISKADNPAASVAQKYANTTAESANIAHALRTRPARRMDTPHAKNSAGEPVKNTTESARIERENPPCAPPPNGRLQCAKHAAQNTKNPRRTGPAAGARNRIYESAA